MKKIKLIAALLLASHLAFSQSTYLTSFYTDTYGGPSKSISANNKLFFSAYDTINGRELWCTDGTIAGTIMVKDINAGISNGITDYFDLTSYVLNGILFFRANDGSTGIELWRSDGTASGTYLVKDISPGASSSGPGGFASVGNILYFTANVGSQLWRSDGTDSGTVSLKSFNVVGNLCGYNGKLYFSADDNNTGQELWRSNGTPAGTQLLKDLNGTVGASLPCNFHATSNALYFMAMTASGWELWKTTGTAVSTVMVKDINPGGANSVISFYSDAVIKSIGETIYFGAQDGVNGYQLWKSDGTDSGTVMLTNLADGISTYSTFPIADGKIMVSNYALPIWWQYDPASNTLSATAYPHYYYFDTQPNRYSFIGDNMIYADKDTVYGCEMWRSNGAITNTKIIQETHLTDNWYPTAGQGFHSILGNISNQILFTMARNPINTQIPLYRYDALDTTTCYAPSIIVPVPNTATKASFIWNRIPNTINYTFRYREAGIAAPWTTVTTSKSFVELTGLQAATDYEYQVSSDCGLDWSDAQIYNTAFAQTDYLIHIIAERGLDNYTEKIYWLQTPYVTKLQVRYRPYGTIGWTSVVNGTGCNVLTGLIPATFYEYEYRPYYNGSWGTWYPSYRYFVTENAIPTALSETQTNNEITMFPMPASTTIQLVGITNPNISYTILSISGQQLSSGKLINNALDIRAIPQGTYLLKLTYDDKIIYKKLIKTNP